jgi:NAD(P)-dependent dehydrogenase (short-subunit alcohol dehydrogenase family)
MPSDTLSLSGKTALVTGSGRENGIGAAIATAFARNGADVAIHHVSESTAPRAAALATDIAAKFGVKTTVVRGAVDSQEAASKLVKDTLEGLGASRLDILGKLLPPFSQGS